MRRSNLRTWGLALVTISMVGVLAGCRSVPDDTPLEQAIPQTFADLIPESTAGIVALHPEEIKRMSAQVPMARQVMEGATAGMPAVIGDLLDGESLEGREKDKPFYVAVAFLAQDDLMKSLRLGAPINAPELLSDTLHFRIIVPAENSVDLAANILTKCEERRMSGCNDFAAVEAWGAFVIIDMIERPGGVTSEELKEMTIDVRTERPSDTVAFRALESTGAAIAVHSRFTHAYDFLAIMNLATASQEYRAYAMLDDDATTRRSRQQLTQVSVKAASEYLFDSPGTAEFEDVTWRVEHVDGGVTVDMIMSLTAYGKKVTDALAIESTLARRTLAEPALDIRWGFDLSNAISSTQRPLWAQDVPGMAPEPFANMMDWKTKRSTTGFPLAVMRSPVTGYALFDKFVGDQTTPADFAQIRSFWMQLGLTESKVGVAAMGLDLPIGADVTSFKEFADVALLPFGRNMESRSVEREANQEFQATTGQPVADLFTQEVEAITPGVSVYANLHRLFALFQALDQPLEGEESYGLANQARMISSAFLPNKYRQVFVQGSVGQGQGILRLQLGFEEPTPIEFRQGAPAPRQIAERSPCLYRALEWSVLAVEEIENTATNHEEYVVLVNDVASGLDTLAGECASDEPEAARQISWIAGQWRAAQ